MRKSVIPSEVEITKLTVESDEGKAVKKKYIEIDIKNIEANEWNPNEMNNKKFNLLCDNIKRLGLTKPLEVVKIGKKYRVVDGEHRLKACQLLGLKKILCCVLDIDEDMQRFQTMRMNLIKGSIDPVKFTSLYDGMSKKYGKEILQDMMGFADHNEFERMYKEIRAQLPPELRKKLDETKDEIKSIEGLSSALNTLFSKYGHTLDYNYMWFDFGGKKNLFVECSKELWEELNKITEKCYLEKTDINEIFEKLIKIDKIGNNDD